MIDPDRASRSAFVLSDRHPPTRGHWHSHRRAQLVHAAQGVLTVHTDAGRFVAPPHRAVWVPGGVRHRVSAGRAFRLSTLYVTARRAPLGRETQVVLVDPLLEHLLDAAAAFGPGYPARGPGARLVRVILDRLEALPVAPLSLPSPTGRGISRIARALLADPSDRRDLPELARIAGLTARTAARHFRAETGMTFGRWRQQVRLLAALERLGAGESVTEVAFAVGYEDVSAFIAMFKRALGTTPAKYF